MREFVSPARAAALAREGQRKRFKAAEEQEKLFRQKRRAIAELGDRGAGKILREYYEQKFEQALEAWLTQEPGDAVLAISTHTKLREYRAIIRHLTSEAGNDAGTD